MRWRTLGGLVAAALGGAASAQGISQQEAAQLAAAAGFSERRGMVVNQCGHQIRPRFVSGDMNGDGRPEVIAAEVDPACHGGTGEKFSILWRDPAGRWQLVGAGTGRLTLLQTRTAGWRDYSLEGAGCQPVWAWDGARYIIQRNSCGAAAPPGSPGRPVAAAPPPAASPAAAAGSDREAAFRAAGFPAVRGKHPACDWDHGLSVMMRDINGDGRLDAIVTDSGTDCYGMTGTGYVIVTKDASGAWRRLFSTPGIPTFLKTRGVGGWPDIENGGPGFCFSILRWNGKDYTFLRSREESPGACARR